MRPVFWELRATEMCSKFITYSLNFFDLYIIAALKKFLPVDCLVAGLSSLLVVFFVTGIVAGMGFPTFVADHGCVFFPQHDDTYGT